MVLGVCQTRCKERETRNYELDNGDTLLLYMLVFGRNSKRCEVYLGYIDRFTIGIPNR